MSTPVRINRRMTVGDPYTRAAMYGPEVLTDAELLAVILRTGYGALDAVGLATELLQSKDDSLGRLLSLDYEELLDYPGIGRVKAVELLTLMEISKRIARENCVSQLSMNRPGSIAAYYMEHMSHQQHEEFRLCLFDSKFHLMDEVVLSRGTVSSTAISPREIFSYALRHRAVYIVILHNHPSGICEPSEADIALTNRVATSGELLNIPLVDHIIIGDQTYFSFKEEGLAIR